MNEQPPDQVPGAADAETLAARLARLEQRVARIEGSSEAGPDTAPGEDDGEGSHWALEALQRRVGDDGGVVFAGEVPLTGGQRYRWQWGRSARELLGEDWQSSAETLSALAHPVRLLLLQAVLEGAHTVAHLSEREDLGTSGQVYHHLRPLVAAGWLRQRARGEYVVPGERVVPLLVVIAAVLS